jgi:hypothetical protein
MMANVEVPKEMVEMAMEKLGTVIPNRMVVTALLQTSMAIGYAMGVADSGKDDENLYLP